MYNNIKNNNNNQYYVFEVMRVIYTENSLYF